MATLAVALIKVHRPERAKKKCAHEGRRTNTMKSPLDKRIETMALGAKELQLWVLDAIRQGFGHLQSQPNSTWDNIAARMTDAKLGAISRRLRILRERRKEANWPELFFNELADFYLFSQAFDRLDTLSEAMQEELLSYGGRTIRKSDLLQQPPEHDTWLVLGQNFGVEEDLRWRRTWFWAEKLQKPALVLDFAFRDAPFEQEWIIGAAFEADMHYFPGINPFRAVVGEFVFSNEPFVDLNGVSSVEALAEQYAQGLSKNPFLSLLPVTLNDFAVILQEGRFYALDRQQFYLPLSNQEEKNWKLLAVSGGQPISFFAEWDGQTLNPLSIFHAAQVRKL